MGASHSTIADQALDLADGLYELVDVAFTHDLAVAFTDLGSHDGAVVITDAMVELLIVLHDEVEEVQTLGELGALMGTLQPLVEDLHELLLEAAQLFNQRALIAVLRSQRPLDRAFAHLLTAARFGSRQPVDAAQRTALRMALDAVLTNLGSLCELLRALDPIELPAPPPPPPLPLSRQGS